MRDFVLYNERRGERCSIKRWTENYKAITDGTERRIYLFGVVFYVDMFGTERKTTFCVNVDALRFQSEHEKFVAAQHPSQNQVYAREGLAGFAVEGLWEVSHRYNDIT